MSEPITEADVRAALTATAKAAADLEGLAVDLGVKLREREAEVERLRAELEEWRELAKRTLTEREQETERADDAGVRTLQAEAERDAAREAAKRSDELLVSAHNDLSVAVDTRRTTLAGAIMHAAAVRTQRDRLAEQVRRVCALHNAVCGGACGLDDACECEDRDLVCGECNDRWPCPTVRALDDEGKARHA